MDDEGPQEARPIPLFIWVALGALVVLGFVFLLRVVNPAGQGESAPALDVVAPAGSNPGPAIKPAS